jgi:hypothetical protein
VILDVQSYVPHGSASGSTRESGPRECADEMPLAAFPWSDAIVGMGFFPHEVALPPGWRWGLSARQA